MGFRGDWKALVSIFNLARHLNTDNGMFYKHVGWVVMCNSTVQLTLVICEHMLGFRNDIHVLLLCACLSACAGVLAVRGLERG